MINPGAEKAATVSSGGFAAFFIAEIV